MGCRINETDRDAFSPLGLALREERFKIALRLLQEPTVDVRFGGGPFCSLMHIAVAKLDVKTVEILLQKGAPANVKDLAQGDAPIHLLINVFSKNVQNARRILELLANEEDVDLNARNGDNWTPLHLAVKRGNHDAAEALLNLKTTKTYPVDIDAYGGHSFWTALHLATYNSYYRIATLLISHNADLFLQNS